ncbi:hypothetical protein DQ400_09060 [Vreelandella sulfidaeris]|uniref:DUF7305 domain-containing protein n=1 Tax=Vreelandella sulfidaeris TaxID=115553 RepID=A0A365TPF1_9GAMM|nr:hypothetical protein [Halomonas sulfidaeris]RBI67821.1 hypothetical protein DQ400_09060 [Halomonas sulfidaeris]
MKQQQGAALVIVMALLSGALMLGMSGMQSALIDERLAGNYRASVQSQMAGESFLSDIVRDENSEVLTSIINQVMESENNAQVTVDDEQLKALMNELSVEIEVTRQDNEITIKAWGSQGRAKSPSVLVFNASGAADNFRAPFIACQRMRITGSSLAASCRATNDVCSQKQSSFITAESQTYNLLYSLGSQPSDAITLDGDAQAYGSARSQRDIVLTGSSSIKGDAYFQGAIFHGGGTVVGGNETKIDATPQRCDVFMDLDKLNQQRNTVQQGYGNSVGNVDIGGYQRRQWTLTPEGLFYYDERRQERNCGIFDFGCYFNFFDFFLNLLGFDACGAGVVQCNRNDVGWVKHSPVINNTVVVDNLRLISEPTFFVSGAENNTQNNPSRLRMVVNGDFSVNGVGEGLIIDESAQLEIFVQGKTDLWANFQLGGTEATRAGAPPLIINSSYSGAGDAVAVNSGSHLVGNIYAPSGKVSVNSSRVTGSIWAQEINALNNSFIIYNEANVVADSQAIETETGRESGNGFNWQWR